MKRRWFGIVLMLWASVASLLAFAPTALATGEQYTFTTTNTIQASGGVFTAAVTFSPSGSTYTASVAVAVGGRQVNHDNYTISNLKKIAGGGYTANITCVELNAFAQKGTCQGTVSNPISSIADPNATGPGGGSKTTPPPAAGGTTPAGGSTQPTCDAGSMTWVVCPLISIAQKTITWLEALVDSQLKFDPLLASNPAKPIWDVFHNLANVILILIFFAIIFGTAFGLDNYTVKKSLPRLVAASVLIQLSFYIAAVLIDITNVMGGGLSALAATVPGAPKGNGGAMQFAGLFEGIGIVGLGVGALVLLPELVIPALAIIVSAAISLMTVLLILELRILILELLIVLSPLAFALWVLPNTEKAFKMWWEMFTKMLLMYPMIILLFIAGDLASVIIKGQNTAGGANSVIRPLMASLAPIIAFFLVPSTFKFAGKAFTQGAGFISGATGRLNKGVQKGSDALYKRQKESNQDKANEVYEGHRRAGTDSSFGGRIARVRATSNPFNYKNPKGLNKQRINAQAEKTLEEHAAADAKDADYAKYAGREDLKATKDRLTASAASKLQDARAEQRAQSVKDSRTHIMGEDGKMVENPTYDINIASMPLDPHGIEFLKEQVRSGDEDTKIAALNKLSGSQGGINGIMQLRTGQKIVAKDEVLKQDTEVFDEKGVGSTLSAGQTLKEGMRVKENHGEAGASQTYSMGATNKDWAAGDSDRAVVASDNQMVNGPGGPRMRTSAEMKQIWDKGTKNAKGMDLVKPLSAAATDISPEEVAGMSVHEMRRYLDYYQRNATTDSGKKALDDFNASFQTAQATNVLRGKMAPDAVGAVAYAASLPENRAVNPITARVATTRSAELKQTPEYVTADASKQIYEATGGNFEHASQVHARIKDEIEKSASGISPLKVSIENKIIGGGKIDVSDLGVAVPTGPASTMPDNVRVAVEAKLANNLSGLAAVHKAWESNDRGYQSILKEAYLNAPAKDVSGVTVKDLTVPPPPPPRPAPK